MTMTASAALTASDMPQTSNPITGTVFLELIRRAAGKQPTGGQHPSYHFNLTANELAVLAQSNNYKDRVLAAQRAHTTTVLRELKDDPINVVRNYVAENPNTPLDVLEWLYANDDGHDIELALAMNPTASGEMLEALVAGGYTGVREAAMRHPSMPEETLRRLAENMTEEYSIAVAQNPGAPGDLLEWINEVSDIHDYLLSNPECPVSVLEYHSTSSSAYLRFLVAEHSRTPENVLRNLAHDSGDEVKLAVASNSSTAGELLEQMARSHEMAMRAAVAGNSRAPEALLYRFARSPREELRAAVAANRVTPDETLAWLASDNANTVQAAVAGNMNTPAANLMGLPLRYTMTNEALEAQLNGLDVRIVDVAVVLAPGFVRTGRSSDELIDAAYAALA